jgi:hypothetical protein
MIVEKSENANSKKLLRAIRQYSKVLLNWRSGITYLLCIVGLLVYEHVPLRFLQLFFCEIVAKIYRFSGHLAFTYDINLIIDGFRSQITKECTYMELFFVTAPLVIRKETFLRNVFRLCVYLTMILFVNLVRLILTKYFVLAGLSWKIGHDLISDCIYYGILIIAFFLWMRAQFLQHKGEE